MERETPTGTLKVSTGTDWVAARSVSVMLGDSQWHLAKSVKISDGVGNWTTVWAPLPGSATVSLAPAPVAVNGAFTVRVEFADPLPAGTKVEFIANGTVKHTVNPSAGVTQVLAPNMTHAAAGSYNWTIAVTISGNTSTYGPAIQTVEVPVGAVTLNLASEVSQGSQWMASASLGVAAPSGTEIRFVATNTVDSQDVVDSGWKPWGATLSHTDMMVKTRTVVVSVRTPAGQTATASKSIAVQQVNYSVTVPSGGDLQAALDAANNWFKVSRTFPVDFDDPSTMATVQLESGGVYTVGSSLRYRGGVRLVAVNATIRATVGTSTHMFSNSEHGGGGYNSPHTDWMILGGTLDCQNYSGGISTSHTRRFRLDGVTIKNIGGRKHNLEINSSGGPAATDVYNCQVYNCTFLQESKSTAPSAARAEDEAIQLDYSWTGAAPTVANDGTVTNNVHIKDCVFTNGPRSIGAHTYSTNAAGVATNVLIEGCTFTNVNPDTWGDGGNSATSEGAVRAYVWSKVVIRNNRFTNCLQPIMFYIPSGALGSPYNSTDLTVEGNTFTNCGGGARHAIYGNAADDSKKYFYRVLIKNNTIDGTWNSTGYFAGCDETDGTVYGYSTGVVITGNTFKPTNYDLAGEKGYNKYRAANTTNKTGVTIESNKVSDGSIDNS